ncbi:MAG: hypothetical protein RI903_548 [Bacteroidota bacterium]
MSTNLPIKNLWKEEWKRLRFSSSDHSLHYEISNYGRIKSFQHKAMGTLIQGSSIQGYKTLNIRTPQKAINQYVHKLVAAYFIPLKNPLATYVAHVDFDKQNNRVENLRWMTRAELTAHNKKNPFILFRNKPTRTKNYKLTESKVLIIKQLIKSDKSRHKMIAKQFGITHTQLNRIKTGVNWKHVKLAEGT